MPLILAASVKRIMSIISGSLNLQWGVGYTLYNEGRNNYLNDNATSSTYRGKTDDTGATWYVTPNPYNESGYLISSSQDVATKPTNCLYAYQDAKSLLDKSYYLCSTTTESVDLGEHEYGTKHYYQLPTFQFYTYDQLFALAKKCGYTGTEATGTPTQKDWADLVYKINASRVLSDQNTVSSNEAPVHNFVIASRRYHKFLNPNRSLEKASCHFLMTAIRKTVFYMLDP